MNLRIGVGMTSCVRRETAKRLAAPLPVATCADAHVDSPQSLSTPRFDPD